MYRASMMKPRRLIELCDRYGVNVATEIGLHHGSERSIQLQIIKYRAQGVEPDHESRKRCLGH
jgi:hypothetical protein